MSFLWLIGFCIGWFLAGHFLTPETEKIKNQGKFLEGLRKTTALFHRVHPPALVGPDPWHTPEGEWDPLLEEFQELEREVQQRDCPHEEYHDLRTVGHPDERICAQCGKTLSVATRVRTPYPLAPALRNTR